MFSGLRYILGYTDEAENVAVAGTGGLSDQQSNRPTSPLASTSIEKTLSAATTKLTEQLLTNQTSIEQLQSTSHQLLPSIKEQLEENDAKKVDIDEATEAYKLETADDNDGDDLLEADSWELLDLVEPPKVDDSKVEIIPDKLCKSTSGILKSTNDSINDNNNQQSRQKPKVSFETPDLVNDKQELERVKIGKVLPNKKKAKTNKKKRTSSKSIEENHNEGVSLATNSDNYLECSQIVSTNVESSSLLTKLEVAKAADTPVLNYAKALAAKPKIDTFKENVTRTEIAIQTLEAGQTNEEIPRSLKRNRPMSTSSWSSSDEIEAVRDIPGWVAPVGEQSGSKPNADSEHNCVNDDDFDKESIASSGFSDCDYGFGNIHDYVVKPRKSNTRRNRTQSGSSGLLRAPKLRGSHSSKIISVVPGGVVNSKKDDRAVDSSKNCSRQRKKKLILTAPNKPICSSDFLKSQSSESRYDDRRDNISRSGDSKQLNQIASSSNDSSDIAEMDESWYVTPPPCFTGAMKQSGSTKIVQQPKAKQSERENALIEYPSVYINESSKVKHFNLAEKKSMEAESTIVVEDENISGPALVEDTAWLSDSDEAAQLIIDPKSDFNIDQSASGSKSREARPSLVMIKKSSTSKKQSVNKSTDKIKAKTQTFSVKKPETKAWKNKFIVDDWDLDEQEDIESDFENMFEPVKKKKIKAKKQQQQSKHKKIYTEALDDDISFELSTDSEDPSRNSFELTNASVNSENTGSVELISIRSLPMDNSINDSVNVGGDSIAMKITEKPENRRKPIQVKPIEPERRPGWQLRRQRSRRRPLGSSSVGNKQQPISKSLSKGDTNSKTDSSNESVTSSRSTPTLIDRIGSSIVANLTNLTNGLVSSGALNSCSPVNHSSPMVDGSEKVQQNVLGRPTGFRGVDFEVRKHLSKGSLKRQNICAKQTNRQRRPDRRLKMFAHPNGCSVNRKVHASIH